MPCLPQHSFPFYPVAAGKYSRFSTDLPKPRTPKSRRARRSRATMSSVLTQGWEMRECPMYVSQDQSRCRSPPTEIPNFYTFLPLFLSSTCSLSRSSFFLSLLFRSLPLTLFVFLSLRIIHEYCSRPRFDETMIFGSEKIIIEKTAS